MQDNIQDLDVQTLTMVLGGNGRDADPWGTGDQPVNRRNSDPWGSGDPLATGRRNTDPWNGRLINR